MKDIIAMKGRNSQIRIAVERLLPGATESVRGEVLALATRLPTTGSNDAPEWLAGEFDNLKARALILVGAGVAKREDFPGID